MKNIIQSKWDEILQALKTEHALTDVSFRTWLLPLEVHSVDRDLITISVDDDKIGSDSISFVQRRYGLPLKVAIEEVLSETAEEPFEHNFTLEFCLASQLKNLDYQIIQAKKNDSLHKQQTHHPFLNSKYTFDTFIVGANNNLAHAASLAVAEAPADIYNPLFIYGGVGLGKTHLMHSIAHFILERNPNAKVLYVTSEIFTNELIDSIRNDSATPTKFRDKFRNIDVLLIDDIQFIIGKERTQEEFFHTFNALHESKKQIVISSDKPPKDIETLEERLRSRFEWGLTVDIQSPDYETRMAILKRKEEMDGLKIDSNVIEYIASNVKSNIRELEGALTKIVALSRLKKKEVDVPLAEEVLNYLITSNYEREITPEFIAEIVAEHYGISDADLFSKKKSRNIAYPRQITMYLCRQLTELSLSDIGKSIGNRDHTTVLHGIEKITKDLRKDTNLVNSIDILSKKLNP